MRRDFNKKSKGNRKDDHYRKGGPRKTKDKFSKVPDADETAVVSKEKAKDYNNDPNWYFTDPVLADSVSQLSWNRFLGIDAPVIGTTRIPDVMTIRVNPSPGVTYSAGSRYEYLGRSGFNMVATKLFNKLSMKSGRNMAYAPQDVGTMLLAQGEVLSMVSYVRRLFAIAQTYNMRNRAFPKGIIAQMGIDPTDFFDNYSDYRMQMNTLLASINQIPVLTNSGYLRKCAVLYDNIYTDTDNSMAQMYMFIPNSTWILDETTYTGGTILKTTQVVNYKYDGDGSDTEFQTTTRTFQDLMNTVLRPMVAALLESSTLNLVYADLLNLAEKGDLSFFKFVPISEDDVIVPIHDQMILKQIHNSYAMGFPHGGFAFGAHLNVTPDNDVYPVASTNTIAYNPGFAEYIQTINNGEWIVDTDTDRPDTAERIELTRWKSAKGQDRATIGGQQNIIFNNVLTDHYVVSYETYRGSEAIGTTRRVYKGCIDTSQATGPFKFNAVTAMEDNLVANFDWNPIIYYNDRSTGAVVSMMGDLSYFTTVTTDYLIRINQLISMGLYELR